MCCILVHASHWVPFWCFWITASLKLKGTLESLWSNVLPKAGHDQIQIRLLRPWSVFHRRMPRRSSAGAPCCLVLPAESFCDPALTAVVKRWGRTEKVVSKQERRIWWDQQRAQTVGLRFFSCSLQFSWLYLALAVYRQCFNRNENRLTSKFGSYPGHQLGGVRYKARCCSINTVLSADVDSASLGCCDNVCLSHAVGSTNAPPRYLSLTLHPFLLFPCFSPSVQ